MKYPRIHLAIDNCFASKRWTRPRDWMRVVADAGLQYVEASADTECDPLYADSGYLRDWTREIGETSPEFGVKVVNLYSGHGTYATLGLAHTDRRVRDRMQFEWLERMLQTAGILHCGLGFFCHAFDQATLQNPEAFQTAREELTGRLAELAAVAAQLGAGPVGVEQMYTPHQIPWTLNDAEALLKQIKSRNGHDFYLTIDTGHQSGQHKFRRPDGNAIEKAAAQYHETGRFDGIWLGPTAAYRAIKQELSVDAIQKIIAGYPHLFAEEADSNTYAWLRHLGAFSPIIHLQQTDGRSSAHQPFNPVCNSSGIIKGEPLLRALADAFETEYEGMPEKCRDIYLTLEIFASTSDLPLDIEYKIRDSVAYWRQFVPQDGLPLNQLTGPRTQKYLKQE